MLLGAVGYPKPLTVSGYKSVFFGTRPDYYPTHPEYAEAFAVDDFAAAFVYLENDIILDFRISWAEHIDTCGDAVKEGGTATVPSSEIVYNQAIIDGIIKSAEFGRENEIEIPED